MTAIDRFRCLAGVLPNQLPRAECAKMPLNPEKQKSPPKQGFLIVAGAGFEPATFGL